MNQDTKPLVPVWYWAIAIVALLWNLLGCFFFGMELFYQEEMMVDFTEAQKEWSRSIPVWIYVLFGISVFSGTGGSFGLLMRKQCSRWLLDLSLATVLIQMGYTMILAGGFKVMGPQGAIMPIVVISIGSFLVWFVRYAGRREWLHVCKPASGNHDTDAVD